MSGVYGYYRKDVETVNDSWNRALTFWNADYGTHVMTSYFHSGMMSVNLEHFSSHVKEQGSFLENDSYLAVIDALIYNREEFENAGDLSDEELLFNRVCRKGFSSLREVNGDFAGVFYKKASGELILFTDHLGVRPLFYYLDADKFIFSTDVRALEAIPECILSINEQHLFETISQRLICGPAAFAFQEIHVVDKGCFVIVKSDLLTEKHTYWNVGQKKIRLKDRDAYQKELFRLVNDAIMRRANAVDGPLGAELSGGLDSSVISILLNHTGRDCRFFSWSAPSEQIPIVRENDERVIIDAICRQEKIRVQYNSVPENPDAAELMQEMNPPYGNTTTIRIGSRWLSGQRCRAVFSGHGGDEGVSHRCRLYELWYHGEYIPYLKAVYRSYGNARLRLLRTIYSTIRTIPKEKERCSVIHGYDCLSEGFWNPEFSERMKQLPTIPFSFSYDAAAYVRQRYLNNRTMNTAYQAAESGVRYLFPYLDYRVIDFAVSIPRWLYHDGTQNRLLYIGTFRDIVPDELIRYYAKETISCMDRKPDIAYRNKLMKDLTDRLDESIWKDFLDINALRQLQLSDSVSDEEYDRYTLILSGIFYCVQLQYTWEHAGEAVNEI